MGTVETDAVVIGAGVCGIAAGLHLRRRGVKVVVVERHTLASGASSRNAGFLMRGAAENYALAVEVYGRELARTVWRWTEENLAGLREEGAASVPGYRAVPSCLLALEGVELAELRRSKELMEEDGFEVGWVERGTDAAWSGRLRPLGGLLNPNDGSCNPYHLMRFLAGKLGEMGGRLVEGQEVIGMTGRGGRPVGGVEVRTADGVFRASHVLVCTNAYTPLLMPGFPVVPRRGQMLALRVPAPVRLDCSYYANHGYEYFRQPEPGTLVVGGRRKAFADEEVGYEDRTTPGVQGALETFAADVLGVEPAGMDVAARWSGTMGFSPDGLPLIGPLEPTGAQVWPAGRVWFCGGFTGHGMSMAYRSARAAVEAMLAGEDGGATPTNPLPLSRVLVKGSSRRPGGGAS